MSAASNRLADGYYNSQPKTPDNPGGMDNGGHVTNFPAALQDVATVAADATEATAAAAADANTSKLAAAASAASAADDLADLVAGAAAITDAAAASASAAAGSAGDAQRTVANNFLDRLDATGSWFSEASAGDPGTIANPATAPVAAAGYGFVYVKANAQGQLFTKGVLSASNGKIYEIEAEVEQTVKGGAETPAMAIGLQGLDAAYASTGAQVRSPLTATPPGVTILKYRFGYAAPTGGAAWPQPGTSVWLRPYVLFNRKSDNSGPVTASTARVRRLTIRDVTAVVAAEIQAAAAAASAATLTYASTPEALALANNLIASPARVKEMIDYFIPFPIGSYAQFVSNPGAPWIAKDGKTYLIATYPALAEVLGVKYAPAPTLTVGHGPTTYGLSGWVSAAYSAVSGEYFMFGPASSTGSATLMRKPRAGGTNAAPTWSAGGFTPSGSIPNGLIRGGLTLGLVGGQNVVAFATTLGLGVWNITAGAFFSSVAGFGNTTGAKVAIGKGLIVARTDNTIGVANAATGNNQMAFTAKAAVPVENAIPGLGVEFSSLLNAFVTCSFSSPAIATSSDAAAAIWTAATAPVPAQDFCVTTSGHVFVLGVTNDLWVSADLVNWKKIGVFPGGAGSVNKISSIGGLGAGVCNRGYLFDQYGVNVDLAHAELNVGAVAWDGKGLVEANQFSESYLSFPIDLTTQFSVGEMNTDSPQAYWKAI